MAKAGWGLKARLIRGAYALQPPPLRQRLGEVAERARRHLLNKVQVGVLSEHAIGTRPRIGARLPNNRKKIKKVLERNELAG